MTDTYTYSIGQAGLPWGAAEKAQWLAEQFTQRSYITEVVDKLEGLNDALQLTEYACLDYGQITYPLFAVSSREWHEAKPIALITGGVHGYETSGVLGALHFIHTQATRYAADFNIVVVPCVSPWAFETINRWNPSAIDPNRSFVANSPAPESAALMNFIGNLVGEIVLHIDLHETTDTDNSEFRPALGARDGNEQKVWDIPDGFYLVGDTANPQADFQKAIINAVAKVTHIALADGEGKLIGETMEQAGVINYPNKQLGLCAGLSNAEYVTTTEVYPDSPNSTPEICIQAQVAAVTSALDYVKGRLKL
jgi:hypothetical protein